MITAVFLGGPNDGETLPLTDDLAIELPDLIGVDEELYELAVEERERILSAGAERSFEVGRALYQYVGSYT